MGYKLGLQGYFYRNTGSYAVPVWDLIPNIGDLSLGIEADEADMTNRNSGGIEMVLPSIIKAPVEGDMLYDPADTDYIALRDACLARTLIEYAVADGPIATSGTVYWRAKMYVLKCGLDQKLREGMRVALMFKPGYNTDANPAWVTVA